MALAKKHWVVSTAGVVLGKVVDLLLLDVSDMVSGMAEIILPEAESKVNLGLVNPEGCGKLPDSENKVCVDIYNFQPYAVVDLCRITELMGQGWRMPVVEYTQCVQEEHSDQKIDQLVAQ